MPPLVYLDRSDVRPGKLDELRAAYRDLAAFVEANEPGLTSYAVYFSEDDTEVSVLHIHADGASLDRHLSVIRDRLPPFAGLLRLRSIEVFGEIDPDVRAQLEEKARLLGADGVLVNRTHAGFLRTLGAYTP